MKLRLNLVAAAMAAAAFSIAAPAAFAEGKTWKVSVAQVPMVAENREKGVFIDMLKAMERASGDRFDIQVVPFARSMADVAERKADFQMALLQVPGSPNSREKFDFATPVLFQVNFVLYTNKASSVTLANVSKAKIETDAAHTEFFEIPVIPSTNLESSIRRVDAGRLDGLIFADPPIDAMIKGMKLANIKRTMYKRLPTMFVLPKGDRGGATDKFLTATVEKLKSTGEWAKLVAPVGSTYDDWQP